MEGVEHSEKTLARHMKDSIAALNNKLIDENAAAGAKNSGHRKSLALAKGVGESVSVGPR